MDVKIELRSDWKYFNRNVLKIIRRVRLDVMIDDVVQPTLMLHILLPHYSFHLALLYACLSLASRISLPSHQYHIL